MGYAYAAAMFVAGIFIIYFSLKENKLFCIAGGYFLLMGVYWLLDELLTDIDLFAGAYGIAFRCVTGVVAAAAIVLYFVQRKRNIDNYKSNKDNKDE